MTSKKKRARAVAAYHCRDRRPPCASADQVRAGDQPEDREGPRARCASHGSCAGRRGDRIGALFAVLHEYRVLPSRPGELHPEPLTDPDLTLSRHPARATARSLPPSVDNWRLLLLPVGSLPTAMT